MNPIDFFNGILQCFSIYVTSIFQFYIADFVSLGGLLVALSVLSLFVSIFVVRLKK